MRRAKQSIWMLVSLAALLAAGQGDFPVLTGPYLGQKPPGMIPKLFAPEIISTAGGAGCYGFLNDGKIFVFKYLPESADWRFCPVRVMEEIDGHWTKPASETLGGLYPYNFTVGPDGRTLYFSSLRPAGGGDPLRFADIWKATCNPNGWSRPVRFESPVNTEGPDAYPTVAADGTLYFMSVRAEGMGKDDIYRSRLKDGTYPVVENIGLPVNSEHSEVDPFVAPDERYLIFCSDRPGGRGNFDLYVSFHGAAGRWSQPVNMGDTINTAGLEFRPSLSPDGKYFFFTRYVESGDKNGLYWVSAKVIDELRPKERESAALPGCAGPYVGQKPPGITPEIFAPGIVSTTAHEVLIGFFDNAKTILFERSDPGFDRDWIYIPVYTMRLEERGWTPPAPASPAGKPWFHSYAGAPEGTPVFFAWKKTLDDGGSSRDIDIWKTIRAAAGWAEPQNLGSPVNSDATDSWPSLNAAQTLYFFSSRAGGFGKADLYRSRPSDGRYAEVENLGPPINSASNDHDPFIDPNDNFLIWCSDRPDGNGGNDLFVSFRKTDGTWSNPKNMGGQVNTAADETRPYVTPDGQYLFFNRLNSGNRDIFWVSAKIIEELKENNHGSQ